ncbi:hypothetical protein PYW08_004652 [Mythimna loreyi]|uniref:Uncharacterized protein n=1 Tax=Mythimna loreyi TaxID=667449 RepID=A0ACC2QPE7_9NEOP|nr:hypothetical protein PYW08_004652 [Mythimna loreyi]
MKIFYLLFIFLPIHGKLPRNEKVEFCEGLVCDEKDDRRVCGVRYEDDAVTFKVFSNECRLLKYGCRVDDTETYGLTSMKYCRDQTTEQENIKHVQFIDNCANCTQSGTPVCGIRPEGKGFIIRTFENECQLKRYNCENYDLQFTVTDYFICSNSEDDVDNELPDDEESLEPTTVDGPNNPFKTKNIVVVRSNMLDSRNINKSISSFFAATHRLDLRLRSFQPKLNESTRRRLIEIFGPIKVFEPWTNIPANISDDFMHAPTLNSCFHKCPTKCPDLYAPVCGVPGTSAREPRITFLNHCFMDVAQCKMRVEGKSQTASSSAYIENPFLFCLGDEFNSLYRFLPLIRTLQHMGRLKKKGNYHKTMRNWRFFNSHPAGSVNIRG